MPRPPIHYSDQLLFRVAELLVAGKTTEEITVTIRREFPEHREFSRLTPYKLLPQAAKRNVLRLVSPPIKELIKQVSTKFGLDEKLVHVVHTSDPKSNHLVAAYAAEIALTRIREFASRLKQPVGLGLGPGRATRDFAAALGSMLQAEPDPPQINLYAIAAGCPARSPEYASPSFFNLFPAHAIAGRIGMFAETVVRAKDFMGLTKRPGIREVFENKHNIHVVVNSMGDLGDEHDLLATFLRDAEINVTKMIKKGLIGSVQYRPFTSEGPYSETPEEFRAATAFELSDFARMSDSHNHHVLLIARQCGADNCGLTRARSLRPLLTMRPLRVFREIVMDVATARELLRN